MAADRSRQSGRGPWLRRAVLVVASMVLVEAVAALVLGLRPGLFDGQATGLDERYECVRASARRMLEDRPASLARFDADLGWRPRPGVRNGVDDIERHGLRSRRDYAPRAAPGWLRVAAFGDSFVYGSEVATDEAWPTRVEGLRPRTEVLNFGVPGHGEDQILLRFLAEARELHPDIVLFGVATPTLIRIVKVTGVFQAPASTVDFVTKPRFVLDARGELELVPNHMRTLADLRCYVDDPAAIRELGAQDYWYEPLAWEWPLLGRSAAFRLFVAARSKVKWRYWDSDRPLRGPPGGAVFNEASTAFRILTRILERFESTARDWGLRPIVLVLPDGRSMARTCRGQPGMLDPVRALCRERGWDWIDVQAAFAEVACEELDRMFVEGFHYSSAGNQRVAEWVARELDRR